MTSKDVQIVMILCINIINLVNLTYMMKKSTPAEVIRVLSLYQATDRLCQMTRKDQFMMTQEDQSVYI